MYQTDMVLLFMFELSIRFFVYYFKILRLSLESPSSPCVSLEVRVHLHQQFLTYFVEGKRKKLRVLTSKRAGLWLERKVGLKSPDLRGTFSFC